MTQIEIQRREEAVREIIKQARERQASNNTKTTKQAPKIVFA